MLGRDGGNGGGSGEGAGGEGGTGGDTPSIFDDFLKTGGNQAEFDRRVQKAGQYGSGQCTGEMAGIDRR